MWNAKILVQVWTRFAMYLSYDDIHYTTSISKVVYSMFEFWHPLYQDRLEIEEPSLPNSSPIINERKDGSTLFQRVLAQNEK